MKNSILIVEKDKALRFSLGNILKRKRYNFSEADSLSLALEQINKNISIFSTPDVVFVDIQLLEEEANKFIQIKKELPHTSIILSTGFMKVHESIELMKKQQVFDYVTKPFSAGEIAVRLEKALEMTHLRSQIDSLSKKLFDDIDLNILLGMEEETKEIEKMLKSVLKKQTFIATLVGEIGTGKHILSKKFHYMNNRFNYPFLQLNIKTTHETKLESILFGQEMTKNKSLVKQRGLFEQAEGGTIVLHEISLLPRMIQNRIIKTLEDRQYQNYGGRENHLFNISFIATSSIPLDEAYKNQKLTRDFYLFLKDYQIELPALRDRKKELSNLTHYFIDKYNNELGRSIKGVTPENLVQLKKYDWPGNIRELKSCIEKAIFISEEGSLINIKVEKVSCAQPYSLQNDGDEGYVSLEYLEKQHIEHVLLASKGNKHQAAQILGIDRTTLYNKLKKYQSFQNIENLVLK